MRVVLILALCIVSVLPFQVALALEGIVPCDGVDCQACHLIGLGNNIIRFFVGVGVLISTIVFAIGGFLMVTSAGNTSQVDNAKKMFTNSILGLVLILSSWLIVDTVLKALAGGGIGVWNQIECVAQPNPTQQQQAVQAAKTSPHPGAENAVLTDAEARQMLQQNGIDVNKTQWQGTSLEGINASTLNDAIALKKSCGCNVTITGGTESTGGHAAGTYSHGTGYKYDMRLDSGVNNYIESNYNYVGTRSDGAQMYQSPNGAVYARESTHWDVLVK